jgi:hypothetical protein
MNFLKRVFVMKGWYCRQKSIVWFTSDFVVLAFITRLDMCFDLGLKALPVEGLVDELIVLMPPGCCKLV